MFSFYGYIHIFIAVAMKDGTLHGRINVCRSVCLNIHICNTYKYTYIYIYINMCIYIYIYTNTQIYIYTYICMFLQSFGMSFIRHTTQKGLRPHMYFKKNTYVYVYSRTYTLTNIHPHTLSFIFSLL